MKLTNRWIEIFLFALFSLPLPLTALHQAQASEGSAGLYVFEYCHSSYSNSGSFQTYDGFSIDNEGTVWSYDHGEDQWSPNGSNGLFYENDLYEKYRNLKQVGTVDKSVLSSMVSLIEPASRGETNQTGRRVEGMDSMTYNAYLFDPGQGAYKAIVLSMRGSGAILNMSSAAKTLIAWMEAVFPQDRTKPREPVDAGKLSPEGGTAVREPVRSGKVRPVAGAVVLEPVIIQKITTPKPEIKVEVNGPFPIEERSKIAFSESIDNAFKMTSEDLVIDDIEYFFEPKEDPTKLVFSVKITNTSNRNIKYHSNVQIPQMSMSLDHTDSKSMMLKPGETFILRGYGCLRRVEDKEYQVIPASTYFNIIATVSPPYPAKDDNDKVTKSIRVMRGE